MKSIFYTKRITLIILSLFCIVSSSFAQKYITGCVVDEKTQEPVISATVRLKGNKNRVLTNAFGDFKLKFEDEKTLELIITYVGYKETHVLVTDVSKPVHVMLQEGIKNLDEVVIIGYGTTTRDKNTGSVSFISGEYIEQAAITNIIEAIQFRVPGIRMIKTSGAAGAKTDIEIRGKNSMNIKSGGCCRSRPLTKTAPLVLVDGIPFNSESLSTLGLGSVGELDPLSALNPSDVERVEILKDADATAIYGSRGSNGVILITTRKGY